MFDSDRAGVVIEVADGALNVTAKNKEELQDLLLFLREEFAVCKKLLETEK